MNKTTEALKLAEEALNAMLTHMGMDEDEWTKPTFNQAREALAAIREALAEPVKQEPVAWCELTKGGEIGYFDGKPIIMPGKIGNECHPTPLYAAPVSVEAIRVEALEEAAKLFETNGANMMTKAECAAAIRGLK